MLGLLLEEQASASDSVVAGVFTVAPYVMVHEGGTPTGALIDYFDKEVAPRAGVTFRWTGPVSVARLARNLETGDFGFTPILTRTPERLSRYRFSPAPFMYFQPLLSVRTHSDLVEIKDQSSLYGMTVGYIEAAAFPDILKHPQIKLDLTGQADWESANLNKLKLRRIDAAYFSDVRTADYFSRRGGVEMRMVKLPVPRIALHAAYSLHLREDIARRIDAAIAAAGPPDFDRLIQPYLPTPKAPMPVVPRRDAK